MIRLSLIEKFSRSSLIRDKSGRVRHIQSGPTM
jgi:hypothetical protein